MSEIIDIRDRLSAAARCERIDEYEGLDEFFDWLRPYIVVGSVGFVAGCLVTVIAALLTSLFL